MIKVKVLSFIYSENIFSISIFKRFLENFTTETLNWFHCCDGLLVRIKRHSSFQIKRKIFSLFTDAAETMLKTRITTNNESLSEKTSWIHCIEDIQGSHLKFFLF